MLTVSPWRGRTALRAGTTRRRTPSRVCPCSSSHSRLLDVENYDTTRGTTKNKIKKLEFLKFSGVKTVKNLSTFDRLWSGHKDARDPASTRPPAHTQVHEVQKARPSGLRSLPERQVRSACGSPWVQTLGTESRSRPTSGSTTGSNCLSDTTPTLRPRRPSSVRPPSLGPLNRVWDEKVRTDPRVLGQGNGEK